MPQALVVIPCFNEEKRLDARQVARLAEAADVRVLLVDDGSRDRTKALLQAIVDSSSGRVSVLAREVNGGKGEAVRLGMLAGLATGAAIVGYLDADFSTPVDELLRMTGELARGGVAVVMGSRVARAGAQIKRSRFRHVTGRVFATAASLILRERFYDTQCGAKLFRDTPALREALATPFLSRWAFDVELLGRLLGARQPVPFAAFVEVPLRVWEDVGGSKLSGAGMAQAAIDLLRIDRTLAQGRRG